MKTQVDLKVYERKIHEMRIWFFFSSRQIVKCLHSQGSKWEANVLWVIEQDGQAALKRIDPGEEWVMKQRQMGWRTRHLLGDNCKITGKTRTRVTAMVHKGWDWLQLPDCSYPSRLNWDPFLTQPFCIQHFFRTTWIPSWLWFPPYLFVTCT